MARVKKSEAETPLVETEVIPTPAIETSQPTTELAGETLKSEEEKSNETGGSTTPAIETSQPTTELAGEIPDFVLKVLKVFAHEPKLFVGKSGDVFMPGTSTEITGKAVLYTNPYYKSN